MKVHIVCKEPNPEKILRRLALTLAEQTCWTLGATPRGDVDLNYSFPYLDYEPIATKTAAWFTHLDTNHPEKVRRWQQAAQAVNLRTTSARIYLPELERYGATVNVPPPIDRKAFSIADAPTEFTVGVSGFTYDSGRKGEDLIRRLMKAFPNVQWQAIGRGWGQGTKQIDTAELPGFYQSLSLFVCASRIEGVPMTVLEALSCGVPVVIPRNVGLLDDLPDLPSIFRFIAGDFNSLSAAFQQALDQAVPADREALRQATFPYTPQAWARAHERAFEDFLNPAVVEALPDWHGRAGMYCVAYGDPARECAKRLLTSWQAHMNGVPMMLASSAPLDIETHFYPEKDYDVGGRLAKLSIDRNVPKEWEYVLYLDADTELVAPIPFLFDALQQGWDFVICTNPGKYHSTRMMQRPDNKDEVQQTYDLMGYDDLLQLNGGVFAYRRNARTAAFFEAWISEWMQNAKRDQAALLRALWKHPLKVCVLTNVWNTFDEYNDMKTSAGILHHQREARRTQGIIWERGDSEAAFKRVMK